jgi:hypothetical protein
MTRQQGHAVLNAAKQGELIPAPIISEALKATGDLISTWNRPVFVWAYRENTPGRKGKTHDQTSPDQFAQTPSFAVFEQVRGSY